MLVTFSSPAHGDVTMFSDVAISLLNMMGRSDTVPSALYAEDVQAALDRLTAAVTSARLSPKPSMNEEDEDDDETVSISHRALPLIELLEAAANKKCTVMWDNSE